MSGRVLFWIKDDSSVIGSIQVALYHKMHTIASPRLGVRPKG